MATKKINVLEQRILAYLVVKAAEMQTTTYEELALEFGLPSSGNQLGSTLSPILAHIAEWCIEKSWPKMTVLVVRKSGADMGLPGRGFWELMGFGTRTSRSDRVMFTEFFTREVFDYFGNLQRL
jgi:hypothetical protein